MAKKTLFIKLGQMGWRKTGKVYQIPKIKRIEKYFIFQYQKSY